METLEAVYQFLSSNTQDFIEVGTYVSHLLRDRDS